MKRIRLLCLVLVVATSAVAGAAAAQSPKAELASMRYATNKEHSVHYAALSTAPGYSARTVNDVATGEGIQRITVTDKGHTGHGQVRVVGRAAYLKGDAFTMRIYFGFLRAQAKEYAERWIFIQHSSTAYASIAAGVTFPSFVRTLFPATKLSLVTSGSLIGVHGTANRRGVEESLTVFAPAQ